MSSKAPVAQLDRASDYGSEGCKFESCRARHLKSLLMGCFFIPVGFTIPPMFQTAFDGTNLFSTRLIALRFKTCHWQILIYAVCWARHLKSLLMGCFFYARWIYNSTYMKRR